MNAFMGVGHSVKLVFCEGKEMLDREEVINKMVEIHMSVNEMYSPSLHLRFKADTEEVLKEKLYQRFLERIADDYNFFLLYVEDELVGFNNHKVEVEFIKGDYYNTLVIGTTCVHADHQNKGYGKYIYSFLELDSKIRYEVEAIVRSTWSTNLRQIHLYDIHGFNEYITYHDYYGIKGLHMLRYYKIMNETAT